MEQDRYAPTYRAFEARQVMDWIKAGQSGCLIGLRGAGKSNFIRFLFRSDVRQHYLGPGDADFVFVLIDLLALVEHTNWAVYIKVLDRLLEQSGSLELEEESVEELLSLYRDITHSINLITAQQAVEQFADIFCRRLARRVVLFFDEFDSVFQTLTPSLFRCLRAIRDAHKGQVSYVIAVASDLAHLRGDLARVEHFYRLVSRNVCTLGPYNDADSLQMIRYLASRRSVKLNTIDTTRLVELSGGHAGLIKATLSLLWDAHQDSDLVNLVPALKDESVIQAECRKVWDSLSESERETLRALARETQANPHTLRRLKRRGLVREDQFKTRLFSPLFADFVLRQAPPASKYVVVSRSPRLVQIDDQLIETLTELEFEMLCYLYEHRGRVCTKDELIANVYRQQYDKMTGGVTDEALQRLISRLRSKIEPERKRHRYIVTVRREGYKFVEPGEH